MGDTCTGEVRRDGACEPGQRVGQHSTHASRCKTTESHRHASRREHPVQPRVPGPRRVLLLWSRPGAHATAASPLH